MPNTIGSYMCSYCRAACEPGASACPNCGAPLEGTGGLRVSDADRDQAISELTSHFQAGRLTSEEFDERSGRALRARTQDELSALLADLPSDAPPVRDPVIGPAGVRQRLPGRVPRLVVLLIVIVIALIVSGTHNHHNLIGLAPTGAVLLFVLRRRAMAGRRLGETDERWIGRDLRRDARDLRRDARYLRRDGRDLRRDRRQLRGDDRDWWHGGGR